MPFLTPDDIATHLYGETVTEIHRIAGAGHLQEAIAAAEEEARGYLGNYDLNAIFSATGTARNPLLLLYVKDIAVWHFIQLGNPGVEMDLRLTRYERAIKWLEGVQSGRSNPMLPHPAPPLDALGNPAPQNLESYMRWGSELPRRNHY